MQKVLGLTFDEIDFLLNGLSALTKLAVDLDLKYTGEAWAHYPATQMVNRATLHVLKQPMSKDLDPSLHEYRLMKVYLFIQSNWIVQSNWVVNDRPPVDPKGRVDRSYTRHNLHDGFYYDTVADVR